MLNGTKHIELPELEWGEQLISSLMEVGPAMPGMGGPVPVTYQEIDAWSRLTNTYLPWYESTQIRQLSREYCAEAVAAKDPNRPKPKLDQNINTESVNESFRKMVNALKGQK